MSNAIARGPMPGHVRSALLLLWGAWLISACAWLVHLHELRGHRADLYSSLGLAAVAMQGALIYLVGRGSNLARLVVLLAAIPAFVVVQLYFSAQFDISPPRLWVETLLRAAALAFLLTSRSARWFEGR